MLIKKQDGFSLLEVLIGATIFTYGALGIAALQISSIKGNSFSGNLSEATTLATNKFEELLTSTYDKTTGGKDNAQGRNGNYIVDWKVTDDTPAKNSKEINVIVKWSVKGVSREIQLTSVRSDLP